MVNSLASAKGVLLSAQCTDVRVNQITPILFAKASGSSTCDQDQKKDNNKMKVFNKRMLCLNFNITKIFC